MPLLRTKLLPTLLFVVALLPAPVRAQAEAASGSGPAAMRDLLSLAYLQFDLLVTRADLDEARRIEVNQAFDGATLAFFGGRLFEAAAALDSLSRMLEPSAEARAQVQTEGRDALARLAADARVLEVEGGEPLAWHLHVPEERDGREGPLPVVVALHGAGGDERMFMAGYGGGRIRALADEWGFAVVSPPTTRIRTQPELLDQVLSRAAEEAGLDLSRVYLVGHSMGAGTSWALTQRDPTRFTGVACIAGPCGQDATPEFPPLVVIAGELDPIAPLERMEAGVAAARAGGAPVDFVVADGWGHTLVVGALLDEAVRRLIFR